MFRRLSAVFLVLALLAPSAAMAGDIPYAVRQAVVWVHCGNRQGSGAVVNGEKGYVLTNAHILLDLDTMKPGTCEVGFIDGGVEPDVYYDADPVRYVYDDATNKDFAVLKIGAPQERRKQLASFPFLKTDEFSKIGDGLSVIGYPGTSFGAQSVTEGTVSGLESGIVKTDAVISPGASGGAGVNASDSLTGMATRILLIEVSPGVEEVVDYELVDIRAVLAWLDTFGANAHDEYVTHADYARYHGPSSYVVSGSMNCTQLAKGPVESTVYCLRADMTRVVFPNDDAFHSWFADFSGVVTLPVEQLATYRLALNAIMKPGSLIKIDSDPKVYLVTDASGTLRHIPSEERAKELYGDGWAGYVKDVPVTFFTNYIIGAPLP